MLKINVESNINSIPYLLYMSEQAQKKDNENENQYTTCKADRLPLDKNKD